MSFMSLQNWSHAMHLHFKALFSLYVLMSLGLIPPAFGQSSSTALKNKKVYYYQASYDQVWKATQMALGSYPLELNDASNGIIKTQRLTAKEVWTAPFEKPLPSNYTQVMTLKIFQVKPRLVQVTIEKSSKTQVDFVGSTKPLVSSGWEELRIFYKIKREIRLERILKRIRVS